MHEKRPRTGLRGIRIHHDNASAHTANATLKFLESTPVKLITHCPYRPDMAPCDFFLFPMVNRLQGKWFFKPGRDCRNILGRYRMAPVLPVIVRKNGKVHRAWGGNTLRSFNGKFYNINNIWLVSGNFLSDSRIQKSRIIRMIRFSRLTVHSPSTSL